MGIRKPSNRNQSHLPRYNTTLGLTETLVVTPPFSFHGVTARVFPLRARMNSLRNFCDRYLNIATEVCELRPYLPYVFLVVLDYGRMAIEEFNTGWISQNEIFFGVPLAMWRRNRQGRWFFDKWVVNTPFIVVDDARSLSGGRESYGWPKVLGTLQTSPERWLIDPRNPTRFLRVDIQGADSKESSVRLLDIEQKSGQNASLIPPDLGMLDPFGWISRLARTSMAIGYDLAQLALAAPLLGFAPQSWTGERRGGRRTALLESLKKLPGFLSQPAVDAVTLKQFRDTEDPAQICYQALVESRLGVTRYNRGGFLGTYNILQGDITGGFRIRLHDHPAFPVVESFGLEVAEEQTFRTPMVRRQGLSYLEPFFPFWLSVDLKYGKGHTICWRTRRKGWQVKDRQVAKKSPKKAYYNTIAGAAEQVWQGPYHLPFASFDVYPLEADSVQLGRVLQQYLKTESFTFEVDGTHVFMVASANQFFSKPRSAAWLKSRQIAFYVPIRLRSRDGRELRSPVLATPFVFVDNPVLATTLREVQGVPAIHSTIEAPSRFLRRQGPMLTLQTDVFAALGAGLPSQRRTLLEAVTAPLSTQPPPPEDRIFPANTLGRLMLKQFRDTEKPDHACYQSLILEPWFLSGRVRGLTPLKESMKIHVYRYPSLPLVDLLGLKAKRLQMPSEPDGAIADILEADQPYRIEISLEIGLGTELAYTAGSLLWQEVPISPAFL